MRDAILQSVVEVFFGLTIIAVIIAALVYMYMMGNKEIMKPCDCTYSSQTLELIQDITVQPMTVVATGYAPLDPNAKEGVCYSGDPKVTASGSKTKPMRTIAADKSIPFGTRIMLEGFDAIFVVEDRGGRIKGNRIDICFATQDEAIKFGKKKLAAVILRKETAK